MHSQNLDNFITIVETGSITRAAQKLFVSQPSLSQYLKRLENSLSVELFDRSTSPLTLTYAGEKYYQYALQIKKMESNIQKELKDIKNQQTGILRLGVALWRGSALLPDIFPTFHKKYPAIRLELFEGRAVQLQSALMNNNIDLAVLNLPNTLNYEKFTCEIFHKEKILLAAPALHPYVIKQLKQQTRQNVPPHITLDVLNHIPLILTKPGQNLTYEVQRILELNHITPEILLDTGNLTTAINLVAAQMACTFVPEEGSKICQHPGKVVYFEIDSIVDCTWELAVVYRKDGYLNNLSKLFIDELKLLAF